MYWPLWLSGPLRYPPPPISALYVRTGWLLLLLLLFSPDYFITSSAPLMGNLIPWLLLLPIYLPGLIRTCAGRMVVYNRTNSTAAGCHAGAFWRVVIIAVGRASTSNWLMDWHHQRQRGERELFTISRRHRRLPVSVPPFSVMTYYPNWLLSSATHEMLRRKLRSQSWSCTSW